MRGFLFTLVPEQLNLFETPQPSWAQQLHQPGAPWRVELTDEDYRRLTAGDAPAGWLTLKAATQALGVSQQTVLK